jgi:hypothetical protein
MVGMAVRDNENVDRWKTFRIDDALGTGRDSAFLEGIAEHGIHEAGGTRQFHKDRSMPEESNLQESPHSVPRALRHREARSAAAIQTGLPRFAHNDEENRNASSHLAATTP